jgi:hypothetical protein
MQHAYSGAAAGVGAKMSWMGNPKVGAGSMEIVRTSPSAQAELALIFTRPFKAENHAIFTFTPTANGTEVSWLMRGKTPLMSKVAGLFMDIEKMVCSDFKRALESLR